MNQEKPWWKYDKYFVITDMNEHGEITGEEPNIEAIVAEAERRGREKALEEVRKAAIQTVVPLSVTLESEEGTESVDIVAVPKSFFER